jgi:hypothetical protein
MTNATPARPQHRKRLLQAKIVWATLLVSQGMIVWVSQTAVTATMTAPDQPAASDLGFVHPLVFGVLSAVFLAAAIFVPRLLMNSVRRSGDQDEFLTKKVLPIWIVRWSLLEMITFVGFVCSMIDADPAAVYPFAAVSLVGFLVTFPSESKMSL